MDSGRSTDSQEESEFILQARLAETLRGPNDSQGMPQLMSKMNHYFDSCHRTPQ